MSAPAVDRRTTGVRSVDWTFTLVAAAVLAAANGFVSTALRGAVGTVSRTQTPIGTWFVQVAILLPLTVVGLLLVSRLVARRASGRTVATVVGAVLVGVLVGVAVLAVDNVVDHGLQVALLQDMGAMSGMADPAMTASMAAENADVHVRAVGLGALVMLAVDLVAVGWLTALLGGRVVRPSSA